MGQDLGQRWSGSTVRGRLSHESKGGRWSHEGVVRLDGIGRWSHEGVVRLDGIGR